MTSLLRSVRIRRAWHWFEWYFVVPVRKVRNRIKCVFGKHFAWNQYFYTAWDRGVVGTPTGLYFCVSCGLHRCSWCEGKGCAVCKDYDGFSKS